MQIYDHVNIDKEQAARYLALRKKDASITWDDIINKGLVACEAMVTGHGGVRMLCEESETFEDDWDKNHKIKVVIFNNCVKIISNYESFPLAYLSPEEAIRLGRFLTSKIYTEEEEI